jgi:hypothetical protein
MSQERILHLQLQPSKDVSFEKIFAQSTQITSKETPIGVVERQRGFQWVSLLARH